MALSGFLRTVTSFYKHLHFSAFPCFLRGSYIFFTSTYTFQMTCYFFLQFHFSLAHREMFHKNVILDSEIKCCLLFKGVRKNIFFSLLISREKSFPSRRNLKSSWNNVRLHVCTMIENKNTSQRKFKRKALEQRFCLQVCENLCPLRGPRQGSNNGWNHASAPHHKLFQVSKLRKSARATLTR